MKPAVIISANNGVGTVHIMDDDRTLFDVTLPKRAGAGALVWVLEGENGEVAIKRLRRRRHPKPDPSFPAPGEPMTRDQVSKALGIPREQVERCEARWRAKISYIQKQATTPEQRRAVAETVRDYLSTPRGYQFRLLEGEEKR